MFFKNATKIAQKRSICMTTNDVFPRFQSQEIFLIKFTCYYHFLHTHKNILHLNSPKLVNQIGSCKSPVILGLENEGLPFLVPFNLAPLLLAVT